MRKRAIAGLAVLGAAITTTMVTSPAYADGYCPANRICMWEDTNFTGDRWVDTEVGDPTVIRSETSTMTPKTSSS